jgi:hypothetical protein
MVDGARGRYLMYTFSLLPVEITVNLLQLVVDGASGRHLTSTFSLLPVEITIWDSFRINRVVAQAETGVVTIDFANVILVVLFNS